MLADATRESSREKESGSGGKQSRLTNVNTDRLSLWLKSAVEVD